VRLRRCGVVCLGIFAVAGVGVAAGQAVAVQKGGNPDAAKIKNPVSATPESVAAGKRSYTRLCVKCHGPEGAGDGTGATGPVAPQDMTDATWEYGGSDGEIFTVIHDGIPKSPDMEGYSSRISDTDIWNLVNYLRTLRRP
jgi:mono/diheme cytochrome c family protein